MRACASIGRSAEDAEGRFGPTPLSEVLTALAPGSVKMVAQETGGTWLRIFGELSKSIRTGEPQSHRVFGMDGGIGSTQTRKSWQISLRR